VSDLSQVEVAAIEGDGQISVIRRDGGHDGSLDRPRV
jgi:uncharacterized membrane protein YcaP (DUF421 family)